MKFKKFVTYGIAESALKPEYWQKVDALTDQRVAVEKDDPKIAKEMTDAEGLLIAFGTVFDAAMIDAAPKLKYIGIAATAFNKVNVAYAKEKGIVVTNLAGYSTEAVAEFTLAVVLDALRQLDKGKEEARAGNYNGEGYSVREIKDKNFDVIGLGHIGQRVAEIAQGFSANVRYWSGHHHNEAEAKGIQWSDIDELVRTSDILSINVALNDETKYILSAERIASLKSGVIVINTAPMDLVDLDALQARLTKRDITFILDHSDEMTKEEIAKITHPNCIIYPPIAYLSDEAKMNKQTMLVGNAESFLQGSPVNIVE